MPTCYRHPGREAHIRCQRCERPICPDCMLDAAVGFHCPECVAEGRKQTRSGRTPYGGERSANPSLTSMVLIGLNAAVWLAIFTTGGTNSRLFPLLALNPESYCRSGGGGRFGDVVDESRCSAIADATWVLGVADGAYWQLLTSMFTHAYVWHIGVNMLVLYFLGAHLESALGRARFLALYLLSGLAGSTVVIWATDAVGTHGASGSIFGLLGALLVIAFKVKGDYQLVLRWLAINLVINVVFARYLSWQGHLGGLIGGLLITAALVYAPKQRRTTVQVLALVALGVLLAALVVARALTLA